MTKRHLTITLQPDWKTALREMATAANAKAYQGEVLNFETPGQFFSKLSDKRWKIIHALQNKGECPIRELARRVGRDIKRVHEDVVILSELGVLERTASGGVICPYTTLHIDMYLSAA